MAVTVSVLLVGCPPPETLIPCAETRTHREGQPCGPCGLDGLTCVDGTWTCSGDTECGLGDRCESNADCSAGTCYFGRCAPPGMAFVNAGTFLMGSPAGEFGRVEGEDLHPVRLTRHYFMDVHEVTQSAFVELMGFNPSYFPSCGEACPVDNLRWVEALAYANARSEAEGLPPCYDLSRCRGAPGNNFACDPPIAMDLDCAGYRLPTEAEWEYAYRAGTTTAFYNGDPQTYETCDQPVLREIARFCGNCSSDRGETFDCSMGGLRPDQPTDCGPTSVGSYAPNGWGLHDMSGNVAEMVWDTRGEYEEFGEDPLGPDQDGWVMVRGAAFCGHMARLRAADRKFTTWTTAAPGNGLRLVRTYRAAAVEERLNDHLCDNGCGGCFPIAPAAGTPCGPCGLDRYVCDGTRSVVCDGATSGCAYGTTCDSDADCEAGACVNDHCVPDSFVYVPAGYFAMGSGPGELGRDADEPRHDVVLERPFMMQRHEVTQAAWRALMGNSPSFFRACGDDCPVEMINRDDALAFANAMSRTQGLTECYDLSGCTGTPGESYVCPPAITFDPECPGFRLPTESEWEYAYRAATSTTFHNGTPTTGALCAQPLLFEIAQFCGNCAMDYPGTHDCSMFGGFANCGTAPVESHAPNAWGLYDMSGNVSEIVWDVFGEYPDFARNPLGPADEGQEQVVRGGGFCGHMARLRAADRKAISRRARLFDVGLRLVRTLPPDGSGPVCRNGCGGCRPITPPIGSPCGPCLADTYVCDGTDGARCSGATADCTLGLPCSTDSDCRSSVCHHGWCTAPGFAYVPPGSFLMGSPPSEPLRNANEQQHPVTLTYGFLMMEHEVTQGELASVLGVNPSFFVSCGADCPAENVTWLEALAYANGLSRLHGLPECYDLTSCTGAPGGVFGCPFDLSFDLDCAGYRLPTEAEWEYAYRAGTSTAFYAGDPSGAARCEQPLLMDHAQFCGNCSVTYEGAFDCSATGGFVDCGTVAAGSRMPNPWGLYDMNGNVGELVWDVLADYPESAVDPVGPPHSGQSNIARGGGFCAHMARLRAADRRGLTRIARFPDVGLRLVRTVR